MAEEEYLENNGIKPLSEECSYDKPVRTCDYTCMACVFFHGLEVGGSGGLWATTGVPKKYKFTRVKDLPFKEDNKKAYDTLEQYTNNILRNVQEKNFGLFLHSIPNPDNQMGTGTGKTTGAVAVLNEYLIARGKTFLKKEQDMKDNPALFVRTSQLQGHFNAQFRGDRDLQDKASAKFYRLKDQIMTRELIVFDDIATRGTRISEAWEEELYQMIDYRSSMLENGATIFTSNMPISKLPDLLGPRIASRINGMAIPIGFKGNDKRKEALLGGGD